MNRRKKFTIILSSIIISAVVISFTWLSTAYQPMPEAIEALDSSTNVTVDDDSWYSFTPKNTNVTLGFIFYPGGRVSPEAYAPLAHAIAKEGFLVIVVPMPFNLAVFGSDRAADVISEYADIQEWVIGGHSLGGSMATSFLYENPDLFEGLILLASYPAESNDISNFPINCITIYGTLDGVLSQNITSTLNLLPENTTVIAIDGGNHAYFGYYGEQAGDKPATITREEQHNQTVSAITSFLNSLI